MNMKGTYATSEIGTKVQIMDGTKTKKPQASYVHK